MIRRALGHTGIDVSALGFGAGPLGDHNLSDRDAEGLVRQAFDLGVTLFDTAPSYGASEARLGRALRDVRREVTLVTKCGYGVPGEADWTPGCMARGVDLALARLGTDVIDVLLLHSCPLPVLARGDLLEPLLRAKEAGKIRAVGYSGDGDALAWAARVEAFDVLECSVNLVDQRALADAQSAATRGAGVLAKRALANAPWRYVERPARADAALYWDRFQAMASEIGAVEPWDEVGVRFAAFAPGVSAALVGTTNAEHLTQASRAVATGDLSPDRRADFERAFARRSDWHGVV